MKIQIENRAERRGSRNLNRSAGLRPAETLSIHDGRNSATRHLAIHISAAHRAALRAFTLIELLTVLAIVGILAALVAPVIIHLAKPDATEAATRQMLDDCARARQLAISRRSTVYMVFIPTNFWTDPMNPFGASPNNWNNIGTVPNMQTSTIVTQMYGAQLTGYEMVSLRSIGDQPGNPEPYDLVKVKTLPNGAFFPPVKFDKFTPSYNPVNPNSAFVIQSNYPMYRFLVTNNIPFPSVDILTNTAYRNNKFQSVGGLWLPYIAFNYLGQLTPGDGSVLQYDEYVPLAYGKVLQSRDPSTKAYTRGAPTFTEIPPGGSTNLSYNLIHIDRITGRARLERQNAL